MLVTSCVWLLDNTTKTLYHLRGVMFGIKNSWCRVSILTFYTNTHTHTHEYTWCINTHVDFWSKFLCHACNSTSDKWREVWALLLGVWWRCKVWILKKHMAYQFQLYWKIYKGWSEGKSLIFITPLSPTHSRRPPAAAGTASSPLSPSHLPSLSHMHTLFLFLPFLSFPALFSLLNPTQISLYETLKDISTSIISY